MPDYQEILKTLAGSSKEDIYTDLLKNEAVLLNSLNSITEAAQTAHDSTQLFENMSIAEVMVLFGSNLRNIFTELFIDKDFRNILVAKDRVLYIGIFLVLIALFLIVFDCL